MKVIIIDSERQKTFALNLIQEMPVDGTFTVETKKTDYSSTARQQRLRFMWFGEVAASGLGRSDTKPEVELDAKWMFARPIWIRDNGLFGKIYKNLMETIEEYRFINPGIHAAACREFTERWISIQDMNRRQHTEFLQEYQRYWLDKGLALSDPALQGLDENFKCKPKKEAV